MEQYWSGTRHRSGRHLLSEKTKFNVSQATEQSRKKSTRRLALEQNVSRTSRWSKKVYVRLNSRVYETVRRVSYL